ncbi:MAG: HEAT repeat domain-containing protein [Verrucomicrobia bacterium]|nr:HEAT repeat domain-containing protein [Verrucomicrobiota bacterium]
MNGATLAQLVAVRSQLTEAVLDFLQKLEQRLDRTPWFRDRKPIAASAIAVPVRVLKESTRPEPPRPGPRGEDADEAGKGEPREASRDYVDPEIAALYEEATREKRREGVPWQQERLLIHRAVVLGGPGSGKSFLTQTTALDLARAALDALQKRQAGLDTLDLPLHFTLARFADPTLPPDPADAVLELVGRDFSPPPCFLAWLKQRLRSRTTWLILDALDEVREDHRPTLARRLRAIEAQGWQTRVLLTCRPANYSREQIPWGELTEYELALFNPLEIRQFVQRWFASEPPRGDTLSQALDRNYSLAHAARTPLIATFLCLAHEEAPVTVTTRRVELYAHVVRGLARHAWKERPLARAEPHVDDLVRFLVAIARPLFQRHPADNLFTHEEITCELERCPKLPVPWAALETSRAGQPMPSSASWPTLLRDELLETGILVGAGLRDRVETQFSFAHRSLLEYLVARNLSEEAKTKGWSSIAAFVDKKSWHPAWQEAVVFLAGLLADPQPLLTLLSDSTKDDQTRQRLCLTGRCLPELTPRQPAILVKSDALLSADSARVAKDILALWLENARDCRPFSHLTNALPFIAAVWADSLVVALLSQLQGELPAQRALAAEALGHLGPAAATDEVLSRLTDILHNYKDGFNYWAEKALGRLCPATAPEVVLSQLAERLRDPNWLVRFGAARALYVYDFGPAAATEAVLSRLTECLGDPHEKVRSQAASTLGRLGPAAATEAVLTRLTERMRDHEWTVCMAAAEAFGTLNRAAVTEALLNWLTDWLCAPEMFVRASGAAALRALGPAAATEPVLSRLTDCLRDPEEFVRLWAANALGRLGPAAATEPVLNLLTDWLCAPDSGTRFGAARTLGDFGPAVATEAVVSRLSDCLNDRDLMVRLRAAITLGEMRGAAAIETVLGRLTDCVADPIGHGIVNSYAAEALGRLSPASATITVLSRLTNFLCNPNQDVRANAVKALGSLGPTAATETVLSRLTELLRDRNDGVRANAAEALDSFMHAGIRWFGKPDGSLLVRTISQLSGEKS